MSHGSLPSNVAIFRAAPSLGFLWIGLAGVIPVLPVAVIALNFAGGPLLAALVALPAVLIAGPFLFLAALYPTMRYEIDDEALTLRYGPILRYRIPLDRIESVQRRDLDPSVRSSVRVPGLALFRVAYVDAGVIRMCATRATEGVLVVKTTADQYGLTPADEAAFLAELKRRLSWPA